METTKQVEPQPALRVTAPPSKNEKKVAAGRAGAAARKAKSERLERELAEAKEALRDPTFVADPPAPEAAPEEAPIRDKKQEGSMLYLGALVAAVGGLIYWSKFNRAEQPQPKEKKTTLKNSAGPAQQLKVAHNPHYME